MNLTAAYGLLAHGLLFGALIALLPLGELRARAALAATTLALLVGIAPTLHGIFGAPSATLLQLAILQLAGRTPSPMGRRPAIGLLVFASLYYPLALGWGSFDPYALGYQPTPLLAALTAIALVLWWQRQYVWLSIIAIDLLAYASGIFANLWEALFDPLLMLIALFMALRLGLGRWLATSGSGRR